MKPINLRHSPRQDEEALHAWVGWDDCSMQLAALADAEVSQFAQSSFDDSPILLLFRWLFPMRLRINLHMSLISSRCSREELTLVLVRPFNLTLSTANYRMSLENSCEAQLSKVSEAFPQAE